MTSRRSFFLLCNLLNNSIASDYKGSPASILVMSLSFMSWCEFLKLPRNVLRIRNFARNYKGCQVSICVCHFTYTNTNKFLKLPIREGWRYQIGWIFGKIPNGGLGPPQHLRKNILQFLAVQDSSITDIVGRLVCRSQLTIRSIKEWP